MVYIYRFSKNETLKKKWIINMKQLEKDSKTKLFAPGPPLKFVHHISKKNIYIGVVIYY